MSAIHAIPMDEEELRMVEVCVHRQKLKFEVYVDEFQKDAVVLPEIKEKLRLMDGIHKRLLEQIGKIEEGTP